MALSIAQWAQVSDWVSTGGNGTSKTVTGLAWSSGDIIVVWGGLADNDASAALSTPTNANLTFTLQTSVTAGGTSESGAYIWTATAGSAQTSQTITSAITMSSGARAHGIAVWVVTGSPSGVANATANQTETAPSLTVSAGSVVIFGLDDWNATNPPGKTMLTGSGTATERRDAGDATTHAQYIGEWVGTSAGTFSFGPNNYTSLQVAQAAIEILDASGTSATATPAAIIATVTMDGPTEIADSSTTPTTIAAIASIPQASASNGTATADGLDLQDGFSLLLQDGSRLLLQSGVVGGGGDATATPGEIAAIIAMDAVTASGQSNATPTPAAIIATAALDAATLSAGASTSPAAIISTVTMDAPTFSAGGSASPAEIAVITALDAVTASGTGAATATPTEIVVTTALDAVSATGTTSATATPTEIVASVVMDAVSAQAGATATPTEIVASVVMDAVSAQAGATATVTEIVTVAVFDSVSASGGSSSTAAPAAIISSVLMDAATVQAASTASPGTILVLVTIPAVAATGGGVSLNGYVVLAIRAAKVTLS